jgi:hypothetical protein
VVVASSSMVATRARFFIPSVVAFDSVGVADSFGQALRVAVASLRC